MENIQSTSNRSLTRLEREEEVRKEMIMSGMFHKEWLNYIKKTVGKACTFIAYESKKDSEGVEKNYIRVNMLNDTGGKDKIRYEVSKPVSQVGNEDYLELLEALQTRKYENRG